MIEAEAPASERVGVEWRRRTEAEYTSAAITQHLALWLIQIGASPDLIRAGLVIVDDELVHAELSHAAAVAAGSQAPPQLTRERLGLARTPGEPLERDILRACVRSFCVGETLAVPLFAAMRERCAVPVARACLDRVLLDEVRHREFGWTLIEWLFEACPMGQDLRALAQRELPPYLESRGRLYTAARELAPMTDEERAWGLLPHPRYGEIWRRAIERDFRPRFARVGVTLPAAT